MNPAVKDAAHLLASIPLFHEFTLEEMEAFIELTDAISVPAGETIVRQDEPGDCMYILVEGQARVVHRRGSQSIELHALQTGDFFGELALVDEGPRSADVIAQTDCLLFKAPQSVLRALATIYPTAALRLFLAIARTVVGRMRRTNAKYLDSLLVTAGEQSIE